MWDRKRTEGPTPAASDTLPRSPAPPAAVVEQPPLPAVRPDGVPRSGGTAIGKAVTIIGDIHSEEDLFVDGEVQGQLHVKNSKITVGPNGRAKSNLLAREVVIQGQVQGDVEATQKITIRKAGSLVGNIKTTGIIIEDDAYFKGSIDIVRKDPEAA